MSQSQPIFPRRTLRLFRGLRVLVQACSLVFICVSLQKSPPNFLADGQQNSFLRSTTFRWFWFPSFLKGNRMCWDLMGFVIVFQAVMRWGWSAWKDSFQSEWGCQGYSFLPSLCWAMVLLAIFMVMGALMMGNLCPGKIRAQLFCHYIQNRGMERANSDLGFKSLLQIRAKTWTRGSGYGNTMAPRSFCSCRHVATCLDALWSVDALHRCIEGLACWRMASLPCSGWPKFPGFILKYIEESVK